jgi:hypothetical protein
VIEYGTELAAFLVGFMSQSHLMKPTSILSVCIQSIAKPGWRRLYERFFEICRQRHRSIVRYHLAYQYLVNCLPYEHGLPGGAREKKMHFTKYLEG